MRRVSRVAWLTHASQLEGPVPSCGPVRRDSAGRRPLANRSEVKHLAEFARHPA
jgi:hypothetical protein